MSVNMRKLKWYHWIPIFWLDTIRGSLIAPNWYIYWLYLIYQGIISAYLFDKFIINVI